MPGVPSACPAAGRRVGQRAARSRRPPSPHRQRDDFPLAPDTQMILHCAVHTPPGNPGARDASN